MRAGGNLLFSISFETASQLAELSPIPRRPTTRRYRPTRRASPHLFFIQPRFLENLLYFLKNWFIISWNKEQEYAT